MKYQRNILLLLLILFLTGHSSAQMLTGIATQWSDSFREWDIYTDDKGVNGELFLRWRTGDNWTEWQYQIGDHFGTIRQKWSNDASQWEVRGENELVTMRAVWNGDFRHWRISGPNHQFNFECRYGNTWDEWQLKVKDDYFIIYTNWEGDPHDWIIEDDLGESYTFTEKMAMVFLAVFNSSPRE